ncbi:NAD-dependent epimerase/dehydratase family protein [Hippea alviniae]|uniref:NAD-dependent epimerase/dehydratase family protein n=1 Tax=Hippea alviniae TaxID=1279027 RepID=UPI0003B4AA0B|nr:NAD(P)-dependent oxidoreductase [Hippea alviniae]
MKILLTGATGFVGINAVNYLKKKHEVVAFLRDKSKAKVLNGDVEITIGDIVDKESIDRAIKGVDAVVHIGGLINASNLEKLYLTNRIGSRNIAQACIENGINNIVYISSLAARGPDGFQNPVSHYGCSKRLGELEFIHRCYNGNLKIIRPPIIYGPYDKGCFELFRMAKRGILPKLNRRYSFVFIDDFVKAIEKLLNLETSRPEIFYISGSKAKTDRINRALFNAVSKSGIEIPIPDAFIGVFSLLKFESKVFSKDKIREIRPKAWTCNNDKLFERTKFKPSVEIEEGFKITARWYKEHGWL